MNHEKPVPEQWDHVAAELQAYRDYQQNTWGDLDNELLGQYLAGELTGEAKQQVEAAFHNHPDLLILTELVRDVLVEPVPAVPVQPAPVVLSFTAAKPTRSRLKQRVRQWLPVAAAACLLIGLGTQISVPSSSRRDAAKVDAGNLDEAANHKDYLETEQALYQVYKRNKTELGETDPQTLQSLNQLASLYEEVAAENTTPTDVHATYYRSPTLVSASTSGPTNVRFGSTRGTTQYWESKKVQGSQQMFAHYGQSLPSAAVLVLVHGATQKQDDDLRQRCVRTLSWMGPAAQPELKARLAESKCDAETKAAVLDQVCQPIQPGVRDKAKLYKASTVSDINVRLKKIADEKGVTVVIETGKSELPDQETQKWIRAWQSDRNQCASQQRRVYILVAQNPALARVAFDNSADPQREECCTTPFAQTLSQTIEKRLKSDRDRDRGLEEAVQLLEEKLKQDKSKR